MLYIIPPPIISFIIVYFSLCFLFIYVYNFVLICILFYSVYFMSILSVFVDYVYSSIQRLATINVCFLMECTHDVSLPLTSKTRMLRFYKVV